MDDRELIATLRTKVMLLRDVAETAEALAKWWHDRKLVKPSAEEDPRMDELADQVLEAVAKARAVKGSEFTMIVGLHEKARRWDEHVAAVKAPHADCGNPEPSS